MNANATVIVDDYMSEKDKLAEYESYISEKDAGTYQNLLTNYDSFKHALVHLVCASASASSKTQDAYAYANGDVASFSDAMESDIKELEGSVNGQTAQARGRLSSASVQEVASNASNINRSAEKIEFGANDMAGDAGRGFAVVAKEILELAESSQTTANRIQEINETVTRSVHNLSQNAQCLVDYLNESILTQFQEFARTGSQYKNDAVYIEGVMDEFNDKVTHFRNSITEIVSSIASITKAIDESVVGISGVADSAQDMVRNMEDIAARMDTNKEIVEELNRETEAFSNL